MTETTERKATWLVFLPQTPATPSSLRVSVWRRLQQTGAVNLQGGAWVLPYATTYDQILQRLLTEIEHQGGSGWLLEARAPSEGMHQRLIARFQQERAKDYQEFRERCQEFLHELEKETQARKFTFAELEENEQDLLKLTRWLRKIQRRDFFEGTASQAAREILARCRSALHTFTTVVYEQEGLPAPDQETELHDETEREA
ncbi:Chromate resistance protein ChrB [Ktedonospora formicarum]|uniref:ChrB N-terminal domain-containing protein n=1 Tax=Ktedonospora formicarum TaxID=2778364 RepID=A0A8J3MVB7_9CHLR|nr:Chromate resistance protein ChrB [Ktedonospora formicarum]GHO47503.1 hypothetical protein KSX_56660 [Ktedonospora formicarum]